MENIKQLAINYLKGGNAQYTKEQIQDAMSAIAGAIPHCGVMENSVFDYDDNTQMDLDTFKAMMRKATNTKDNSLDSNFEILFSVMNSNGDKTLSSDELVAMFEDNKDGKVDEFEIWSNLYGVENISDFDLLDTSGSPVTPSSSGTPSPSTGSTSQTGTPTTSTTPTTPTTSTTPTTPASSGVKVNIDECVEQLHRSMSNGGTDEDTLRSILFDENISDEDFVKIVSAFEQKYGLDNNGILPKQSLVTWIENDTSGRLQAELTAKLGQRLVSAAEKGNEDAIRVLCREIYGGTAGQNGTANDFLKAVFNDSTSTKVISQITQKYPEVNKGFLNRGRDLVQDIKDDYNGLFGVGGFFRSYGKEGNSILAVIQKAARITYE